MVEFPITFKPTEPVEFEGNTYAMLTFPRPIGWPEILASNGIMDAVAQMNAVTASLASVPVGVIAAMSLEDQLRLSETVVQPICELPPVIA